MSTILIFGATSAMAEHCARLWAARGDTLVLVGRSEAHLHRIAADLRVRGAHAVDVISADLNAMDQHPKLIGQAVAFLKTIDTVLIAHGTLSDQKACEHSVELTLSEIQTNALSTVSLLTLLATQFEHQGRGHIAVISSVAGDRGRATNYVYGSAKALVTAFASGLRQRLSPHGIHVLTIKPGLIDTPMTSGFSKGPLWAQPAMVAIQIVKAIDQKKSVVYVPGFWRWIMGIIQLMPHAVFNRMRF